MNKKRLFWLTFAPLSGLLLLVATWVMLYGAAAATTTPLAAAANPGDVVINEVAWMGTAASASDEWIELYNNTDAPITLTNWTLTADDGTPSILLSGVIPARGYFLLERTDDATVSDVPADQIYTGSLGNDPGAEILRLRDENSALIDAVNGDGGSWPAGDNSTKQTMERISPQLGGTDDNWASNDGVTRNGRDADDALINGTPKMRNSAATPAADLVVEKTGPTDVTAGARISYALRLRNAGNVGATAVRLTDTLPGALSFVTQTSPFTFSQVDGHTLVWQLDTLPISTGFSAQMVFTADVALAAAGLVHNRVVASTGVTEIAPINDVATATITVLGLEPDLVVAKSGPATRQPGQLVTYTLRLSNTGQLTATAVRLTDVLPAEVLFITQTSAYVFTRDDDLLSWAVGDLPTGNAPLLFTVTGRISATASGVIRNVVTATTETGETFTANNRANWDTSISGGAPEPKANVLIAALLYDGYQSDDRDEAMQLVNVGDAAADLAGWKICDAASGGSCATIVSGTLDAHASAWLAYWASDFYTSSGFYPAYAVEGLSLGVLALSGSWPRYANDGDEAVLLDASEQATDTLVYEGGDVWTWGWSGAAVEPWSGGGVFGTEGQMLYRALDESSGLPISDTNSAADWAQYADDPACGRRVRYPGWDLETFYRPLTATAQARVTVGVAPDNAADVVLGAIASAQSRIEIGVYELRHPTIIQQLITQASAGVTVTVLLEGSPTGMAKTDPRWYQEMWACKQLHATGHGACWFMINDDAANIFDRYRFMHAKYMLIDRQQVLISTQNLTEGSMPNDDRANGTFGSRGIVLLTDAPAVVARVAEIFDHDLDAAHHVDVRRWSSSSPDYGSPPPDFTPTLSVTDYATYTVIFSAPLTLQSSFDFELFSAPEAALRQGDALLGLLARAGAGDEVYVEQLDERAQWGDDPTDDPSLRMQAYVAAARRGATVRILLNSGRFGTEYIDNSTNEAAVAYAKTIARQEGLDLRAATGDPTHYGIHNKMVLVWLDGEGGYAHVGSLNGSETSNKANRELAIQIRSDAVYDYLKAVFEWDWYISLPVYLPLMMHNWAPPEPPVGYPVISEVLYNPIGAEDSDEWIEIYNPTDQAVNLSGWHLGDVGLAGEYGSGLYTFPVDTTLPPGGILLVAAQAQDVVGFTPDFEFLVDPLRDDPNVPNMVPAGGWEGFGFALGNAGDQVILLNAVAAPVDVLVYGTATYPGIVPHPGVSGSGRSLERRPAIYDTNDCSQDFFERYPPDPGAVSRGE